MSKMDLSKYKGKQVDITLMIPTSTSFSIVKDDSGVVHEGSSNNDNEVSGEVTEVSDQTLTLEFESRSRIYRNEIFFSAIAAITTSELTESGKERAAAARARFTGVKRKK